MSASGNLNCIYNIISLPSNRAKRSHFMALIEPTHKVLPVACPSQYRSYTCKLTQNSI